MRKTASIAKVFRKDKLKNGKAPVNIRIIKFRQPRYIPTGISILLRDWDFQNNRIGKSNHQHKVLNHIIDRTLLQVEELSLTLELSNPNITSAGIKSACLASLEQPGEEKPAEEEPPPSFLVYFRQHLQDLEEMEKWGTLKKAKTVYSKIKAYVTKRLGKEDLLFCEITPAFLGKYEQHLRKRHNNKTNTIYKEMSMIRARFNDAIDDANIRVEQNQYPFRRYKLVWENVRKRKLKSDSIELLKALPIQPSTKDWDIRNMFLFSVQCGGMRISDLLTLRVKHCDSERYKKVMFKTETRLNVLLSPEGRAILALYIKDSSDPEDFVFPILDSRKDYSDAMKLYQAIWTQTAYVNKRLKILAKRAGITIQTTSHVGRGTFITQSVRKGMGLDMAQGIVGHKSRRTTEGYLDLDQEDYDEAMRRAYG